MKEPGVKRYEDFYGDEKVFAEGWIPSLREKFSNLSEFMREIKVGFSRYYNKRHHRRKKREGSDLYY
jgi:hypothetical protein